MAHVSICVPVLYNTVSNYNPVSKKMEGSLREHYNLQLDVFDARNISYDLVIDKGLGRKVDEDTFDGCLGYLQTNKSQFILNFHEYPRVTGEVAQGIIATDSAPYLGTAYHVNFNKAKYLQLSSAFYSFEWTLWVLLCLSLLIIWSTIRVRRCIHGRFFRLRKKKTSLLFQVVSHSLKFARVGDRGIFKKIIFIICSFISLVIVSYFCSLIKTQLVTFPNPPIFSSLQELLDKKITLTLIEGLRSVVWFEFAPLGSRERRLFDFLLAKHQRRQAFILDTRRSEFYAELRRAIQNQIFRQSVYIFDRLVAPSMLTITCHFSFEEELFSITNSLFNTTPEGDLAVPYMIRLTDSHSSTLGVLFSRHFPEFSYKGIRKGFVNLVEHGFYSQMASRLERFTEQMLKRSFPTVQFRHSQRFRDCISLKIIKPASIDIIKITFKNLHSMIFICLLLFTLALLLLASECILSGRF